MPTKWVCQRGVVYFPARSAGGARMVVRYGIDDLYQLIIGR